jgi:hypothetical protein
MNKDPKLTPHITNDQWCELTYNLVQWNCLHYREPLLRLLKRVIFSDESMEYAVYSELPQLARYASNWGLWAINRSRWVHEAPDERLIWVEGIWCGTGLTAKIIQPRPTPGQFQVVVTDDDDWIEHSPVYSNLEAARVMLTRIERCDTLLNLHSTLTCENILC